MNRDVVRLLEIDGRLEPVFQCPGCNCLHAVWVNEHNPHTNAIWSWNGDAIKPTFTPSINVKSNPRIGAVHICHSFVRDGMIQFLDDCTHALKGKTVALPTTDHW